MKLKQESFLTITFQFWLLYNVLVHLFGSKKKSNWSSKFGLCFPPLLALSPFLYSIIFSSPYFPRFIWLYIFIYIFIFYRIESSPEDSVNNLTSQLSLKQCGLGPLLCSVHRGESTAPKGQAGPLALRRTRQVAPHLFTLVWYQKQSKRHSPFHYDF